MTAATSSPLRGPTLAWAVYDFAYSLFTFLLVVRFFPTWIIDDHGRPDWYVSVTQVTVVVFVLLVMPLAGALADQLGRRKPFLIAFSLVSAGACATLSILPVDGSVLPALVVAAIAVGFAQLAFAQYDPLLADVAEPESYGRVSGLAVALGFAGIIFGLAVVAELIVGEGSKQRAFAPAALLYLAFALPALVLIRERQRPRQPTGGAVNRAVRQLAQTVRQVRHYPRVFRFLAGRLFYSEAIATLSAFMAVYMTRLGGFSEREKNIVIGLSVLAAALGAITGGRIVEQLGPKRPLLAVLPFFAASVLLSAVVGEPWTVWVVSPIVGCALGVVWTADRVFMLRLTPPEVRGQFFGFFNLANRVASALGPLVIWSGTVWLLHQHTHWLSALDASRVALVGLAASALVGWTVIRPVPDEESEETVAVAPATAS
jgi:UMF1 family MFS transporter